MMAPENPNSLFKNLKWCCQSMKSFVYLSVILTVVIFVIQNDYLKSILAILGVKIDGGLFEDLIPKILSSLFLILTIFYSAWRAKTWIQFWEKEMRVVHEFHKQMSNQQTAEKAEILTITNLRQNSIRDSRPDSKHNSHRHAIQNSVSSSAKLIPEESRSKSLSQFECNRSTLNRRHDYRVFSAKTVIF